VKIEVSSHAFARPREQVWGLLLNPDVLERLFGR
jgi:carbon monoxide dehydrogenase subunit G